MQCYKSDRYIFLGKYVIRKTGSKRLVLDVSFALEKEAMGFRKGFAGPELGRVLGGMQEGYSSRCYALCNSPPPTDTLSVLFSLLRPPWSCSTVPQVSSAFSSRLMPGEGPPRYSQIPPNKKALLSLIQKISLWVG